MGILYDLAVLYGANKIAKDQGVDGFCDAYERTIPRADIKRMIEIGVQSGGSLRMWRAWFPGVEMIGVDDGQAAVDAAPEFRVMLGDQTDPAFLATVAAVGPFDLVIDDGGHRSKQHNVSFDVLWPAVTPGGWYVVEDLHTSYWPAFQDAGYKPFVERIKTMVASVNQWAINHVRAGGPGAQIKNEFAELHVFQGIAFIRKAR